MNFIAQPPLRSDAHAIADQEHTDHQLRINRGAANGAIVRCQKRPDVREVHKPIDRTQNVVFRNVPVQIKLVEQRRLQLLSRSQHRLTSPKSMGKLNQPLSSRSTTFFNGISP